MTEIPELARETQFDAVQAGAWTWTVRHDLRSLFEGPAAVNWDALNETPGVRQLHSGLHHSLFLLERKLPGRIVPAKLVVKVHHDPRWSDQWRNARGRSHAAREWAALRAAKRHGIGCVEPVALGILRPRGTVAAGCLVTESPEGAVTLEEFVTQGLRAFKPEARPGVLDQLAAQLARFVLGVHRAGLCRAGLRAENILLRAVPGGFEFLLTDVSQRGILRPLGLGRSVDGLVLLNADVRSLVPARARVRFFAEYARGNAFLADHFPDYCRLIERRAEALCQCRLARLDKDCLGTNSRFRRTRKSGLAGYSVRSMIDLPAEVLQLIPDKGLAQPDARLVKNDAATTVWEQRLDLVEFSSTIFVKRYNRHKLLSPLTDAVRGSRAVRAWRVANALANRGLAVARPLAAVERREAGLPVESWLVTQAVGAPMLMDWVARQPASADEPDWRRRAARELARWVRKLHREGFTHRDLKPNNVLVRRVDSALEFVLVDFDGAFQVGRPSQRQRVRDIGRLAAGFARDPLVRNVDRMRFLAAYLGPQGNNKSVRRLWWRLIGQRVEAKLAAWRKQNAS